MRLCFSSNPEHFQAFLDHGVLPVCIKLLIRLASVMNSGSLTTKDQARIVMLMIQAFRFLQLCLQLPLNLPWVLQAIDSGLLTAFVECSPFYEDIKRDDYIMISATFSNTLPRYLTYSCVVRAMDAAFLQLEKTGRFLLLRKTRAWKSLDDLALLTARRHGVIGQLKCIKKNVSACFNPKCEKLDVRNHFRKCARCHTALYCSKECQVTHWKEFRHKQNCRLDTSDRDLEYIQVLNICEIRAHMQYIKSLAATEHPGVPVDDLVVVVDYSVVPTKYKLDLQSIWMRDHPNLFIVPTRKYLPDLTARSTTHIIGILPHQVEGIPKYLTTPVPRGIWNPLVDWVAKSGVDSIGSARWMEREAQARRKLYLDVRA
ncbi:hypothetical protein BDN72DRAFT_642917 [Pluteus cervinus]|uniref:Uncharacterized protein n=1 Tax=Pluteus cervinus TaxID=181527 RepID=A0ACD3ATD0_9AGAR|nr:hypothetical protein BDN72DRAFT_642917 [Pluteus cervinus]